MTFQLKYINIFDDTNTANMADIQDFYSKANIKLEGKFPMPSFTEGQELQKSLDKIGQLDENTVARHLETYSMLSREVAVTLAKDLLKELRIVVPSEAALKSNYGKIAYWAKTVFNGVLNDVESNIYINTTPNKHELYMIYMASKLSNNIVVVDYNFEADNYKLYNNFLFNCSGTQEHLKVSMKIDITLEEVIELLNGSKNLPGNKILVTGEDQTGQLNTELVKLSDNIPSNILLLKLGLAKPSFDEVNKVPRPTAQSVEQLVKMIGTHMFMGKPEYANKAASFAKREIQFEVNHNKAITKLIAFICLYSRYKLTADTIVSYGKLDQTSEFFIDFLCDIGKTVVVIDTHAESEKFIDNNWVNIKLSEPVEYHSYPEIAKSQTTAYNASMEINNTLYTGDTLGLYRDRQYKTCDITVLNTTFDELLLLWDQDNTFKPSFSSTQNNVVVPVFYARLLGASEDYEKKLSKLVTAHSIICYRPSDIMSGQLKDIVVNHFAGINDTLFKEQKPMYKNGKLDIDTIMQYKTFPYRHLDVGVQKHILSKLNTILEEDWIKHSVSQEEFIDTLLNVGLNLSKRIQQEMQWYDYTKQSPKLIILCQDEEMFTLEQSIIVSLLHLCGWDIVIAVPTCYNVLGSSLRYAEIQDHVVGEPKFNLNISQLNTNSHQEEKKKSFFSRLFN